MQTLGKLLVCEGLSKRQVNELIKFTNADPLILATTKDTERFKDKATFNMWLKKNRKIYSLTDANKKLLGIIWFGNKNMPKNIHYSTSLDINKFTITFAIRIYGNARGKGFAKNFIKKTWEQYKETDEYKTNPNKGIWLETNINNFAAVKAYKRVGFVLVSKPDSKGQVLMIQR